MQRVWRAMAPTRGYSSACAAHHSMVDAAFAFPFMRSSWYLSAWHTMYFSVASAFQHVHQRHYFELNS